MTTEDFIIEHLVQFMSGRASTIGYIIFIAVSKGENRFY